MSRQQSIDRDRADVHPVDVVAAWIPSRADAAVPDGTYGDVKFGLFSVPIFQATHVVEWEFSHQNEWVETHRRLAVAELAARAIMQVNLAPSRRLTNEQIGTIRFRGALLQLTTANEYMVVVHGGVSRLARVETLLPLVVGLQAGARAVMGNAVAVVATAHIPLDLRHVVIPARTGDARIASPGVAGANAIADADLVRINAFAVSEHQIANAPAYALNLPDAVPAPAVGAQPAPRLVTGYAALQPVERAGVGSQWTISLYSGSVLVLDQELVTMREPGSVVTSSGARLQWPAPELDENGNVLKVIRHAGPTPMVMEGSSGYAALTAKKEISHTDIMTWGMFLDGSQRDCEWYVYNLRMFLERHYTHGVGLRADASQIARNEVLAWAEAVINMGSAWRGNPDTVADGRRCLEVLRLADAAARGYDTTTMLPDGVKPDAIAKEMARQDAARAVQSRKAGSGSCFKCGQVGHTQRTCPSMTTGLPRAPTAPPPASRYAARVCGHCKRQGKKYFSGHTDETCYELHPNLKPGFRVGGASLRN